MEANKWEDTVMTWKQTVECSHNPVLELRERDICQTQAKTTWPIAFKAGQESVFDSMPENLPPLLDIAYKTGFNKVVEFVESHKRVEHPHDYYYFEAEEWQAFLKGEK